MVKHPDTQKYNVCDAATLQKELEQLFSRLDTSEWDLSFSHKSRMDSSGMSPDGWNEIANIIINGYDEFDAFIVTHGTDTLAYTAAALSFMLRFIRKPVVLIGSQIPIFEPATDAIGNFVGAVQCVLWHHPERPDVRLNGVFVYFCDKLSTCCCGHGTCPAVLPPPVI